MTALFQWVVLSLSDMGWFFGHVSYPPFPCTSLMMYDTSRTDKERARSMLVYEYKLDASRKQCAAIEEAIRIQRKAASLLDEGRTPWL
jgi:hypothetical protein